MQIVGRSHTSYKLPFERNDSMEHKPSLEARVTQPKNSLSLMEC